MTAAAAASPAIEARFSVTRGTFHLEVDLRLPGRGITMLHGASGSGKTTLLRCVAGLERPAGARLVVDGQTWHDASRGLFLPTHRRPLGYVFQEASLFPHLDVRGNLAYGQRRAQRAPMADPAPPLEHVIELLGLGPMLARRADELSGGERQRVAMARALATRPRLLLLDEPLASLDHARKQDILPYLERLRDEVRTPMLYVSHAADEVARLADTLVVLEQGRVLACAPVAETLARLDLPIALDENAGVLLEGRVDALDAPWHLCRVGFEGGGLWVRDHGLPLGARVRLRVLARDVSLATEPPRQNPPSSSIQNLLPCTVLQIAGDSHPAQALVKLQAGQTLLLSRLTRRAVHALALAPGLPVWAQVKSAALVE